MNMQKNLTILDIAKLAGVGKSTVSRVLNDDPNVRPATREKVRQVIEQHGFMPSKSAQAMRAGSSRVVGIIVSRLDSRSENRAVRGMLEVLYGAGYDAVIMESEFDPERTNEHLRVLQRRNADGILLFGYSGCDYSLLQGRELGTVVLTQPAPNISSVLYDNDGAINQLMDHLVGEGCRHVAYVGVGRHDVTTGQVRREAYLRACENHGLLPLHCEAQLNFQSGYAAVEQVLHTDTDAIVCATDTLALGVAKRLQELGREQVIVAGVGSSELLKFLFPNTLTVNLGDKQAGMLAARQLLAQLQEGASPQILTTSSELEL